MEYISYRVLKIVFDILCRKWNSDAVLIYEASHTCQFEKHENVKKLKSRDRFSKDRERTDIGTKQIGEFWTAESTSHRDTIYWQIVPGVNAGIRPEQSACKPLEIKFIGI